MIEKKTAAQALEDIRVGAGVTQAKLAEKVGVSSVQVVQSMLYRSKSMRTDNLIKLADALGYDVVLRNRVTDKEILIVKGEE